MFTTRRSARGARSSAVNRSLNSARVAASGEVHELPAGPWESFPKLRKSTRIDERRRAGKKKLVAGGRACGRTGESGKRWQDGWNFCYLKPTIAVGSRHRKTRGTDSPPPIVSHSPRIPNSDLLRHHDHPQAVLFSLSRSITTTATSSRLTSARRTCCFSSSHGVRRLTRLDAQRAGKPEERGATVKDK